MPQTKTIDEILNEIWTRDTPFGQQLEGLDEAKQALADLLLGLPSLQPLPRIKSVHADNSLAIKIDDIRQEIAEALGVSNAPLR